MLEDDCDADEEDEDHEEDDYNSEASDGDNPVGHRQKRQSKLSSCQLYVQKLNFYFNV